MSKKVLADNFNCSYTKIKKKITFVQVQKGTEDNLYFIIIYEPLKKYNFFKLKKK